MLGIFLTVGSLARMLDALSIGPPERSVTRPTATDRGPGPRSPIHNSAYRSLTEADDATAARDHLFLKPGSNADPRIHNERKRI